MNRKQRQAGYWLGTAAVLAWLAMASGCGYGREPAVVGKQSAPAGENGNGLEAAEDSGESQREEYGESPLAMLDIPEGYHTRIEEDGLVLTADAVVEIPDVRGLGCHEIVSESFTEEEFDRIGRSIADRVGIDWQKREEQPMPDLEAVEGQADGTEGENEEEKRRQLRAYRVGAGDGENRYQVDYVSFTEPVREDNGEIAPSFIWWLNLDVKRWEGSPTGSGTYGKSDPAMAERLPAAQAFEEDAGKLLREWGMEEYKMWATWWMKTSYSDRPDEYRYQIRCTPAFQGISFGRNKGILENGTEKNSLPYIRFDYLEDGTLDVVCLVGKCRVIEKKEKEMFLLPFQAVTELFEQYARDYVKNMSEMEMGDREMSNKAALGGEMNLAGEWEEARETEKPVRVIHVTRAAMEYAGVEDKNLGTKAGKETGVDSLVPVWTFYGYVGEDSRPEEGKALSPDRTFFGREVTGNAYREIPLLSVRADDGQTFMGE